MEKRNHDVASLKRKILIISYHFPPSAAIGGRRAANFAKYLSDFNWDPSVLTIEIRHIETVDQESGKDLETIKIIRIGKYPTLREAYLGIKKIFSQVFKSKGVAPQKSSARNADSSNVRRSPLEQPSQRLKRYVASLLFSLPDEENGWIIPAAFQAIRKVRREKIDCILTSCPPYSVHIVGILVKLMTDVKWVADFRDPWMGAGSKKLYPTSALSNKIECWLEKKVIQNADMIMFNVQQLRDVYKSKYADEPASKFVDIPNGIDSSLFTTIRGLKKYEKFTLSHTGNLYLDRSPEPIFKAINQLFHEGRVDLTKINIKLVGVGQHETRDLISPMIHAYGLEQVVEVIGTLSHVEALKIIRKSHLALLFAPNQPYQIPGKVYDYIGAGATILAIAERSATSDFIKSVNCGRAFDPSDIKEIKEFIFLAMNNRMPISKDHSAVISQYDAKRITESLSDHLNRVVKKGLSSIKREKS